MREVLPAVRRVGVFAVGGAEHNVRWALVRVKDFATVGMFLKQLGG
jgi:hypothetical protein